MIRPLSEQLIRFLGAVVLGAALGLCYDLGRGVRRVFRRLTVPVDMLFGLVFFLSLCLTGVYTRGLGPDQVLGLGIGAGLWLMTLGPFVTGGTAALLLKMVCLTKTGKNRAKKSVNFLRKLVKKFFSSSRKWGTIKAIPFSTRKNHLQKEGASPYDKNHSKKSLCRTDGGLGCVESGESVGGSA